jgi:hypothetical protein
VGKVRRKRQSQHPHGHSPVDVGSSRPPLRLVCPRRGLTILLQSITSAMFEISALVRYEKVYDAAP